MKVSASPRVPFTEPDQENCPDANVGDWGLGRCPPPLTRQAEPKPLEVDAGEIPIEDDDDDLELSDEERWRLEKQAQRADYSGISDDKSSAFFDYDELWEEEESPKEDAAEGGSVPNDAMAAYTPEDPENRAVEHQPSSKRNKKDDKWWQARTEIGEVAIDAVARNGGQRS